MGFRLLGVRRVERGRLLTFERRHYATSEPMVREMVRHPGSVAVLPLLDDEVVLLRQHRTPLGRDVLELPAGLRDHPGEDPARTARRECEEETGYRPGRVRLLHRFFMSPGFTDEEVWLFVADRLEPVDARPQGAEERAAEVVRVGRDRLRELIGEVEDAKTLVGLSALAAGLDAEGGPR